MSPKRLRFKRWLGKPRRRVIAVALSSAIVVGLLGWGAWWYAQESQEWDDFGAGLANSLAQAIAVGVDETTQDIAEDLAAISAEVGKPVTVEDLVRWLELVQRGEGEQAATELRARLTEEEILQFGEAFERAMKKRLRELQEKAPP